METLLIISIVVASIAIPAWAARDARPRRGAAKMLVALLGAVLLYVGYLTLLHPVLFVPHWP